MNVGKIAFIIAVDDDMIYDEALYYIEKLHKPDNMKFEIIPIRGAKSMTAAYNLGMHSTDAKYKVYMHQDVMLINQNFIYEILKIFQNKEIGMIGVAGVAHMPEHGIWWRAEEEVVYMKLYQDTVITYGYSANNELEEGYKSVDAIDGLIMITQYDIPWREDLFCGWHFYDISQSMEMRRKKYQVVVAGQKEVWCLHEQKWNKDIASEYLKEREIFLSEYSEMLIKGEKIQNKKN